MRELKRLSLASPNPLTRALLRSGRVDRASSQARYGAAAALGVAGAIASTATASSASAAGASAGGAGAVTTSKWAAVAVVAKWMGVVATSGALAIGAAHEYGKRTSALAPALAGTSLAAPESSAPAAAAAAPAEEALQAHVPNVDQARSDIAPPVKAPSLRSTLGRPGETAIAPSDLRDEVTALDRVRSALSSNDNASALEALRAYDRAFTGGALASEAGVLRIEVLARAGRRDEAMGAARHWLSREPSGPQARYVRRLLDAMRSGALASGDDAHP